MTCSLDDLICMTKFHRTVVQHIYADWALMNIIQDAKTLRIKYYVWKIRAPLSSAEQAVSCTRCIASSCCNVLGLNPGISCEDAVMLITKHFKS